MRDKKQGNELSRVKFYHLIFFSMYLVVLLHNAWLLNVFIFSHNSKDVSGSCRKDACMVKHNAHLVSYYSDTYIALSLIRSD